MEEFYLEVQFRVLALLVAGFRVFAIFDSGLRVLVPPPKASPHLYWGIFNSNSRETSVEHAFVTSRIFLTWIGISCPMEVRRKIDSTLVNLSLPDHQCAF